MRRMVCLVLVLLLILGNALAQEILYRIEADLTNQIVTVYTADGEGPASIVHQMICSSGTPGGADDTPLGDFIVDQYYPNEREEWYYIKQYEVYVQYVTRFNGPYLFHSLPYAEADVTTIDEEARSQLGQPVSHGCIRLRSEDAKWLAENCPDGTKVRIYKSGEVNEELRAHLLKCSYDSSEWGSYVDFLDTPLHSGLTGALEDMR